MKKLFLLLAAGLLLIVSAVNAGDLDEVQKAGVIQFGVSPDRSPFVFYDENDELTGIDIKLMEEIANRMNIKLEVTEMSSDDLIESLTIGQVDVIGGAFSKTTARTAQVDFTRIYYIASGVFLSKNSLLLTQPLDPGSLSGKKVGVLKNSGFEDWLKSELYDKGYILKKDMYTYDKNDDAIKALDRGKIDLMLMDFSLYQSRYQNNSDYRLNEYGDIQDSYAFAARKGSDLKAEINKHLTAMLKDGTAQEIADKFFTMDSEEEPMIQWTNKKPTATPMPAPTHTPYPTAAAAVPTAAPSCTYSMSYVADITIPDGQTISAGAGFTKTWRIKNTGNCAWTQDFYFAFVSGSQMNGSNTYLPAVIYPGNTVDISVPLVAPDSPGTYQGNWQLKSPQGYGIGTTIWVQIVVPGSYSYPTSAPVYEYPTASFSYPTPTPTFFIPKGPKALPTATPTPWAHHIEPDFTFKYMSPTPTLGIKRDIVVVATFNPDYTLDLDKYIDFLEKYK